MHAPAGTDLMVVCVTIPSDLRRLGITHDLYTHTETERHIRQAQRLLRTSPDCRLLFATSPVIAS